MELIDREQLKATIRKMVEIPNDTRAQVIGAISRAKAIDIVRCGECKHWAHMEDGFGDCTNSRFHLDGHPDPTMKMDDFCSCGEKREVEDGKDD